ncbi:MAG: nucleotidyltransferase family protein [Pseudomonadales bacterium]
MRAMLLAAGRGTRLEPLTEERPKPLLEAGGKPLIQHQIENLAKAGIDTIVINLHHLGEQIEQHLGDGAELGASIIYSREKELLETGGAIVNALEHLGESPFLVLSADVWMPYPLSRLPRELDESCDCHLVLVPNPSFHPQGDFQLDAALPDDATTVPLVPGDAASYTFGNLSVVHPRLFQGRRPEPFPFAELFLTAFEHGRARGELWSGAWFNVGTVDELRALRTHLDNPRRRGFE